jgi:hypothetical protein
VSRSLRRESGSQRSGRLRTTVEDLRRAAGSRGGDRFHAPHVQYPSEGTGSSFDHEASPAPARGLDRSHPMPTDSTSSTSPCRREIAEPDDEELQFEGV